MPNYQNSKIYKLVCGDLTYIGSTTQPLGVRKAGHKRRYKDFKNGKGDNTSSYKLYDLNEDGVEIVLIEDYPCENKEQLFRRERYWIENTICVNKLIPTRTIKEWYEENREYAKQKRKEWYEENREYAKQKSREWYEENKDKARERCKEYRERNNEKIKERAKIYFEANKEKIKEYKKEYYQRKKLENINNE